MRTASEDATGDVFILVFIPHVHPRVHPGFLERSEVYCSRERYTGITIRTGMVAYYCVEWLPGLYRVIVATSRRVRFYSPCRLMNALVLLRTMLGAFLAASHLPERTPFLTST